MFTGIFTGGIIELEPRMLYSLAEGQPVLVIPLRRKKKPKALAIVNKYADTSPADMDKEILTRKKVYKTEKNAKRQLVDKYICQYSPYKTQPLGVNAMLLS